MNDASSLDRYLTLATTTASSVASLVNEMRLTAAAFEKSDGSIVTEADRKAEEFMRSVFEKETPEANIWG